MVLLAVIVAATIACALILLVKKGNAMSVHIGGRGPFTRISKGASGSGSVIGLATLSSPTATATGSSTSTLGVTTDTGSGTLYWVISTSSAAPSAAQIIAGNDSTGSAAAKAGSQAVSATGAQSISATGLTASTTYYAYFVQVTSGNSNVVGSASFTTLAMATPTLALQSASGASPLVLQWSDTDYVVGLYGQLQIASDSGFTTITQNIIFFIDGSSWALNDESIGMNTPSGTYWARIRTCRDNDSGSTAVSGKDPQGNSVSFNADVSNWSNTVTDTINVASAVWNSTTGTNKSQYVTISGSPALVVTGTNGVGAFCGVRTTTSTTGKRHFEGTYTTAASQIAIGVDDGTTALGPAVFSGPNPGFYYVGGPAAASGTIYKNGVAVQTGLANIAAADNSAWEFDTTAGTASFYKNGVQVGSTLTGISMSTYYGYAATFSNDVITGNFGENAFSMTPSTGYAGW